MYQQETRLIMVNVGCHMYNLNKATKQQNYYKTECLSVEDCLNKLWYYTYSEYYATT